MPEHSYRICTCIRIHHHSLNLEKKNEAPNNGHNVDASHQTLTLYYHHVLPFLTHSEVGVLQTETRFYSVLSNVSFFHITNYTFSSLAHRHTYAHTRTLTLRHHSHTHTHTHQSTSQGQSSRRPLMATLKTTEYIEALYSLFFPIKRYSRKF